MSIYKTAFIGLTHMGYVCTVVWASLKQKILAVDNKIDKSGKKYAYEKDFTRLLKKYKNNISFSTDFQNIKNADTVFFAQDTKLSGKNRTNKLENHINKALPYFKDHATIIIMSQVPLGFCRRLEKQIQKKRPDLKFNLYHWVDTIIMTQAVDRVLHPERIIIGKTNKKHELSNSLKSQLKLFNCPVVEMSFESAEITKASINLFLANCVTYANTLSDFCEQFGADINDVAVALKMDKRIGPHSYLRPTLKIAGGHLERDLTMLAGLAKANKIDSGVSKFIIDKNKKRYSWATNKIKTYLPKNTKIAFWGLAYKKDSTSTESAPSLDLIKSLSKRNKIISYDPMAIMPKKIKGYKRVKDKYKALENADCLLIVTEWDEFKNININKIKRLMKNKLIIDCVGILHDKQNGLKGFRYISMGVGTV